MKMTNRFRLLTLAVSITIIGSTQSRGAQIGDVFVINLENTNWTQPDGNVASIINNTSSGGTVGAAGAHQQIFGNAAAPFINSLVTPGNANAAQVSYASHYLNVLANSTSDTPSIHPSEPNYIWQESGSNFGVTSDAEPYGTGGSVATIASYLSSHPTAVGQNLTGLLQSANISWKSYQEGTGLLSSNNTIFNNGNSGGGTLTNNVASAAQKTVPLQSFSGTSATYTNAYNGSHQYNFATKHDGQLFFSATNGGNDITTNNVEASHYSALEQLQSDLTNNTVGRYNLITPDQFNDMHTGLTGSFVYNGVTYTGGWGKQIAQGDNFLSIIIPQIMASQAYQNNGAIVIWTDETEPDATTSSQNGTNHTLAEIVISPLAKGNAYNSSISYDHSSDVTMLQEVFGVAASTPTGLLSFNSTIANGGTADPANQGDLSDLFVAGTIPQSVPEPSAFIGLLGGVAIIGMHRRRTRLA